MPDPEFIAQRKQQIALKQLQRRLQTEQAAFDEGDDMHKEYQAQLDAVQSKQADIANAQQELKSSPPIRPMPPVRIIE